MCAHRRREAVRQGDAQQRKAIRLACIGAQDFEGIAQHHPAAGIRTGKPFLRGLHLDDDGGGQLNIHLHLFQIRELLGQLLRFLGSGEAEQIGVCLHAQRGQQLLLRVNAGVCRGGAVHIFHPENRDLEQQVDRHKRADRQHRQHAQNPECAAAVAAADDFRLGDTALLLGRAGAVTGLLRVNLLAGARRALGVLPWPRRLLPCRGLLWGGCAALFQPDTAA